MEKFNHHPKDLVLDYYHCTFFLPLIGLEDKFQPCEDNRFYYGEKIADHEAQAYRYFSPALRDILFDCKNKPNDLTAVKEWRLKQQNIKDWQLHLGKTENKQDPKLYQCSQIVSVRLFQYFNGIYLLAVRVEPEVLSLLRKQNAFKDNTCNTISEFTQKDSKHIEQYQQLAMENWLHFTRHIRLLYPSFPQQNDEAKIIPIHLIRKGRQAVSAFKDKIPKINIPTKPGHDFSPVMIEFIKAFSKQPDAIKDLMENYSSLYDDRMFVSVAYGIAGEKLAEKSLQRINSLVSYVDRQEAEGYGDMQGYAYTPEVILKKIQTHAFPLWEGLGSYYTYTDFSNSYLSTGEDFRRYIASKHIPHIYDRMLIQALFYQASLRLYDNQICVETKQLITNNNVDGIRQQRGEFVRFTNQYWFHTLTSQMQGKDIFELQQKALGLQQHYTILKDELERTDEYLLTEHQIKMNKNANNFTRYGLAIGGTALYFTLLPIINDALVTEPESIWGWVGHFITCSKWGENVSQLIGLGVVFLLPPLVMIEWGSNLFANGKKVTVQSPS